jgi:hypothetical protein
MRSTLMHDRDHEVARLRAAGYSFRATARTLGMSLGAVQRALRRVEASVDLDDDDDSLLNALRLDDDSPPVGSVRFVGVDETDPRVELFVDERGAFFTLLQLYRHASVDGGVLFASAANLRRRPG